MEDRKRLLALPMPEPPENSGGNFGGGNSFGGGGGNVNGGGGTGEAPPDTPLSGDVTGSCNFVLKPILVDKQLSEPSSPTTSNFRDSDRAPQHHGKLHRQMHRGHSDLGSRVKKRVTLR